MTKSEIASILQGIADILQIKGDELRKVKAYRWAARAVDSLQEDIMLLYEQDELGNIPGVGPSILKTIKDSIESGYSEYYEELLESIPAGVMELMAIQGVGPGTTAKLYQELNIDSIPALQEALDSGELSKIKGFGKKTQEKIQAGIESLLRHRQQKLMGYVLPTVQDIISSLSEPEFIQNISIVGGLRRYTETVKEAHILIASVEPQKLPEALSAIEWIESMGDDWKDSGGSAKLVGDVEFHVTIVPPENFGPALVYHTGSDEHISGLTSLAKEIGLENIFAKNQTEEEIYASLKLPFIVPELREGRGEIQAALAGKLPNLINLSDIRGDLHVHSNWSDGNETVEAMALAAREKGYEYITISDHSISSKIANGLDIERILNKMIEVREVNEKLKGIEILMGAEVDILKEGQLDYPDQILEKLDVVIASVHSGFNMDEATMTERIIKAMENRFVHIIGHPTGRLLGRRDPYKVNMDALIDAAAELGKAFEINSYPDRLDLNDIHTGKARERGVKLAINTDAHNAVDLGLMIYGIYTARRGWLEPEDVLNTFSLTKLMKWITNRH